MRPQFGRAKSLCPAAAFHPSQTPCQSGLHWPAAAHFAHARPSQWPIRIASTPLLHLCDYQKMSLKMGDQKWPKMSLTAIHGDARLVSFPGGEEGPVKAGVGRGSNPSPCTLTWPWQEPTLWESWQMPIFDAKFISRDHDIKDAHSFSVSRFNCFQSVLIKLRKKAW